jgi:hypothetical protein
VVANAATLGIEIDKIHAQNIETSSKQSQGSARAPHPVTPNANVFSHFVLVVAKLSSGPSFHFRVACSEDRESQVANQREF